MTISQKIWEKHEYSALRPYLLRIQFFVSLSNVCTDFIGVVLLLHNRFATSTP